MSAEHFYAVHSRGVVGISLPWLPLLGDFLSSSTSENGEPLSLPQLPSPSALELTGDWGRSGLAGDTLSNRCQPFSHPFFDRM